MRYFLGKDAGAVIREKHQYAGNDAAADALVTAYLASHPGWTAQEVDSTTFAAAAVIPDQAPLRTEAVGLLNTSITGNAKLTRAVVLITMDEINNLRQWVMSFKAAVAAATTLADLKTRVAALSDTPDRTTAQLKTAVENKINAGTAD